MEDAENSSVALSCVYWFAVMCDSAYSLAIKLFSVVTFPARVCLKIIFFLLFCVWFNIAFLMITSISFVRYCLYTLLPYGVSILYTDLGFFFPQVRKFSFVFVCFFFIKVENFMNRVFCEG